MNVEARGGGGASQRGHAVVVFALLLSMAGLTMLWTWTGNVLFVVAGAIQLLVVVLLCAKDRFQGTFEVIGGPWDGARIPLDRVNPSTDVLVIRSPDGAGARYAVTGLRNLVYRGQTGTPE
ncbi:hypothetical protein ACFW4K_18850 [Nocardiopsis alba]|uniref:PH domain-containing protein n=1 Tax=Nocardiopsis alba TaxID=53437 RepID=A0A7K2ITE5_9ACTN|nr:hypothetical protein [Nocardiopsis sp. LDBS1602]MEC3893653.1 hypothetical protein [Nocardiopsis sp. LDBS1602]MYR33242.1 hypothetical protein [Nocardiopsis alba]